MSTEVKAELDRIQDNIAAAYVAAEEQGADLPQDQNTDNLAKTIRNIKRVSSWNDLTDRPFGEETKLVTKKITLTRMGESSGSGSDIEIATAILNDCSCATFNTGYASSAELPLEKTDVPNEFIAVEESTANGNEYRFEYSITVSISDDGQPTGFILFSNIYGSTDPIITAVVPVQSVKKIDEKYLPDTIARVEDIPEIPDSIPVPATAQVGQTIIVKSVDETGKPTEWEAADFPEGGAAQSDWNAAEGEPGHVLNRTHWEETVTVNEPLNITWDGNTEGLVSADLGGGMTAHKISDATPSLQQLMNGFLFDTNKDYGTYDEKGLSPMEGQNFLAFVQKDMIGFMVVYVDGLTDEYGCFYPEKGLYLTLCDVYPGYEAGHITTLTTEPIEQTKTVIKKIDEKYLPYTVATDDEMLDFLMEMDIVHPLSDNNGSVYTDTDNKLYVL